MTNLPTLDQLVAAPPKKQIAIAAELAALGEVGEQVLIQFLQKHLTNPPKLIHGVVYQSLYGSAQAATRAFLADYLPTGIVPLVSTQDVDYTQLQRLLAEQDFLEGDRLTLQKLCELAGASAIKRKWLYFTEVDSLPGSDLQTINTLWLMHSGGKFGFSVQRELWLTVGQDFNKLWELIGWKQGSNWTRYPSQFTWNTTAPRGHLPLSNQLRGVQSFKSLLLHPVWQAQQKDGSD